MTQPDPRSQADDGSGRPPARPEGPAPWIVVERRYGPPMPLFRPRYDTVRHPASGRLFERIVLETADWVNVVALTDDRDVVLVRQFRFGSGRVDLEIPGGVVDPEEGPEEAARRELLEETGYASDNWQLLGVVRPNPAFLDNTCYHFLARRARRVSEPRFEAGEDIAVELRPLEAVVDLVRTGIIDHSLVVAALCRVADLRPSSAPAGQASPAP